MRDYNFFSQYIESRKISKKRFIYILLTVMCFIFLIVGFSLWSSIKIQKLNNQIKSREKILTSNNIKKRLEELDIRTTNISLLKRYYSIAKRVEEQINIIDIVNTKLMKKISLSLPQGVRFRSISILENNLQIQGISDSRISIAELEHNLKLTNTFADVHVSNIMKKNDGIDRLQKYTFLIRVKLKADDQNESK